jgi:NAD(P)-dependent dehydrogenase (short-subunit alcohol dehydrogenase family)
MANQAFEGKIVGGGAGAKNLGGLMSRTFGADGASVVVHYNSDATRASADETVNAVKAAGGDAIAIQGDLTKVSEVVKLFDEAVKRYGRVDIAVDTVGKVLKKPFVETTEEEFIGRLHIAPEGSMKYMALVAGSGLASYPPSSLRERAA